MIKTRKKTKFSTKMCTKEHLKTKRVAEIPPVVVETFKDFQTEKLRNKSLFTRIPTKPMVQPKHPEYPIRRQVASL
mgnify:FL=1